MNKTRALELARATARRHRIETDHDVSGDTAKLARSIGRKEYLQASTRKHHYTWEVNR